MMYDNIHLVLDSTGLNPLDISEYIMQQEDIAEAPEYITGLNQGLSKAGTKINDRIHTAYSFSLPLIPIKQDVFQQIIAKCEENEFNVRYTSARQDMDFTMRAQCSLSRWLFATKDVEGKRVYHGCTITVEGI